MTQTWDKKYDNPDPNSNYDLCVTLTDGASTTKVSGRMCLSCNLLDHFPFLSPQWYSIQDVPSVFLSNHFTMHSS
jgi:hypothetical protein